MEESTSTNQNDVEDLFTDASDDFPFLDSNESFSIIDNHSETPLRKTLRRRRSIPHGSTGGNSANYHEFKDRKLKLGINNNNSESLGSINEEKEEKEEISESLCSINGEKEEKEEISVITNENGEEIGDLVGNRLNDLEVDDQLEGIDLDLRENEDSNTSSLVFCVDMLVKSIMFQISMLVYVFTFPVWLIYTLYMFVIDPFGIMRRGRSYVVGKVMSMLGVFSRSLSSVLYDWLKEQSSVWKLGVRFGWGVLWSAYVCIVLIGLLVVAFVMGGLVVKGVVKEPIRIREKLNFDYTERSPVAYVPLGVDHMGGRLVEYEENVEGVGDIGGGRVIPHKHKLQVTVSLKLPESDYNRNLGNFQVRVDLLTADGKTIASSRRTCMLQFKSDIIRIVLTFLNVAPLITGYASESQTMTIKFRGFTETSRPTACLRVIIEQRAEFQPGGGIPEIYDASLALDSELPLLKRIMWYWKKTIFVWISMTLFTVELFFALLCCRPLVIPRIKLRGNSASRNNPGVCPPVQR